ncbi:hypothetical protein FPZ24_12000 [Sphingomonas panacisoli]|uniref:Uncharacterized protein n=1 Tax=Sphingomonas panacisoli TaxID=1813879 RepID=A0A5B8LK56_9SPHN|nr:hypothetical protein [Sphingomonas panacisoli]QDZ08115.1 hypothetical protein FPZ24_12000 [Sphingomonas panacisoli]
MTLEIAGSRSTKSTVVFNHPFRLGRDSREFPPGTYTVHTHEDVYQGVFDPIHIAISAELIVNLDGTTFSRFAKPEELRSALELDANCTLIADGPSENPDRLSG